jgi:hypothetical protein
MVRRLRIAASVFFAILAVTLCVFWVRSYWTNESIGYIGPSRYAISLGANDGTVYFVGRDPLPPPGMQISGPHWVIGRFPAWEPKARFRWQNDAEETSIRLPCWFAVLLLAASAGIPSIRRFSLRTMLIATSVIAAILGAAVILNR